MRALVRELDTRCAFGVRRVTVQLARYAADARYVRHLDATPALASGRRLTMLLYLNDAWVSEHGGALRLYVRSAADGGAADDDASETAHDVEPVGGRLVVFQSACVPHEVLRTHAPSRYTLTGAC
jgi:SM-20-related protein